MSKHDHRDPGTGRFAVSTRNTPEASEHSVKGVDTYAEGLPVADVSGAPSPNTETHARYAPQGDQLDGGTGRRKAIIIDAASGQHLGTVDQDALRHLIGRRSGHLADHVADEENYIVSGT